MITQLNYAMCILEKASLRIYSGTCRFFKTEIRHWLCILTQALERFFTQPF